MAWFFCLSGINFSVLILYVTSATVRYIQLGIKQDLPFLYFYSSFMLMGSICVYKLEQLELSADKDSVAMRVARARLETACMLLYLFTLVMVFSDAVEKREGAELVLMASFSGFATVLAACLSFWHVFFRVTR